MYEEMTPENIREEMLSRLQTEIDTREGSFAGDLAGTVALELSKVYQSLNAVESIVYVDETSGQYIDKRCGCYGIERKPGSKAKTELTINGAEGTSIPKGTRFLDVNGLEFITQKDGVIVDRTARVTAEAAQVGERYNLPAGRITRQRVSLPGVRSITSERASGGTDPESDDALVERLYAYLRRPASSGNAHHYEQWAMETDGVGAAHVLPLWNGPGTVKVLIAGTHMEPVSREVTEACAAHMEAVRPIGAAVTVKSAEGLAIDVSAQVELEGFASPEEVRREMTERLKEYLRSLAFVREEVAYSRIGYLLLGIDGVRDYKNLTLNGGGENIKIGEDQVPVAGEVTFL